MGIKSLSCLNAPAERIVINISMNTSPADSPTFVPSLSQSVQRFFIVAGKDHGPIRHMQPLLSFQPVCLSVSIAELHFAFRRRLYSNALRNDLRHLIQLRCTNIAASSRCKTVA